MFRLSSRCLRTRLLRRCSTAEKTETSSSCPLKTEMKRIAKTVPEVVNSLTSEFRRSVVGDSTALKFRFETLKMNLISIHQCGYPIPDRITESHLKRMLELRSLKGQFEYLDSVVVRGEDLNAEKISEIDKIEDPSSLTISEKVIDSVSKGDPEIQKKIKLLFLHHDLFRENGDSVPPTLNEKQLELAIRHKPGSLSQKSYLEFVAGVCFKKTNSLIKKRRNAIINPEIINQRKSEVEAAKRDGRIIYGLGCNSIFMRISDRQIDSANIWNVIREFDPVNGTPLVIDLSFMNTMTIKQVQSFIHHELNYAFAHNRSSDSPYAIHLTGFNPSSEYCQWMKESYPHWFEPHSLVEVTEQSYLDRFPKDRLLYLSPDSKNDLSEFRPDDIYVIGGIVDTSKVTPMTLGKAKKENIRHARLPMKNTVGFQVRLNVDHMVAILCEWKNSRDWFSALRFVPTRHYLNRLKAQGQGDDKTTRQMAIIHKAARTLRPGDEALMPARKYRQKFNEILAEEGMSVDDMTPWKKLYNPNNVSVSKNFDYTSYKAKKSKNYFNSNIKKGKFKSLMDPDEEEHGQFYRHKKVNIKSILSKPD